ncbi:protein kinase [candidate division KSB1 bacterium]|nr:protein kinase [candidate division KSB1 bacterium]
MVGKTISHYKILEKLGGGGMGVVYKAQDLKLDRFVALKFLPHHLNADEEEKKRFIHEAKAASALDHPNICTIHEIDETEDGQMFIAMAYYEGETLKKKVASGQLAVAEAVEIAIQIAQGLAKAHEKGIEHRDIKPANLFVTNDGIVKIVDFGLAKLAGQSRLTKANMTLGTVVYMSPEQARGEDVDARTDIWSLGVVVYEMLTGKLPFWSEYEQAVIYSILHETPKPIASLRTGVPMELERMVSKAMAKCADERYQHVDEMLVDLKSVARELEFGTSSHRPSRVQRAVKARRTRIAMIAALLVLAVIVGVVFRRFQNRGPKLHPNRVVVAVFENRTGDPALDPLGNMAADWITQAISHTGLVEVVPSVSALVASQEIKAAAGAGFGVVQVRALAEQTGAGKVISGAYYKHGESIQFQAQMMDVQQKKLLHAVEPVSGSLQNPMEAIERLRQRVMVTLAMHINPRMSSLAHMISQPPSFEAYQAYIEGLELYLRLEFREAIHHLERAATFDSTFMAPLFLAAAAYNNLDRHIQADSMIRIVNQARERITPIERHLTDWLRAELQGNKAGALGAIRQLVETTPSWDLALYQLGYNALQVNRPRETVEVFAQIDPERGLMKGWASYYAVLTAAYHTLGDHRQELKAAQHGRRQYPDMLRILAYEARALAALGRIEEGNERLDEGLALPPQGEWTPTRVMEQTAAELREHGHRQAAFAVLDRAISWYQNRPSKEAATASHRYGLGRTLYMAERWEEAQALFEKLAVEDSSHIDYQGHLGTIAARRGEVERARRIAEQLQRLQRPYLSGNHTYWRAKIAALSGERERAVTLLREAFAQGYNYGAHVSRDMDLESMRDYPPFQELMKPKG